MGKSPESQGNAAGHHTNARPGILHLRMPRGLVLFICVVVPIIVAAAGLGGFYLAKRGRAQGATTPKAVEPAAIAGGPIHRAAVGPWGELDYQRTVIEAPEDCLPKGPQEWAQPSWFFKGYSAEELGRLFTSAGLKEQEKTDLLNKTRWRISPAGISVDPAAETVLSLSPAARKLFYEVLARFEENPAQASAFHWPKDSEEAFFAGSRVADSTLALVKGLSYTHGRLVMFADLAAVLQKLPKQEDKIALEKVLYRQFTLLMKLSVKPESNIESLVRYWGQGGCAKDLRPLLEAAARIPEGKRLSVLALLPPTPRVRAYTFPCQTGGAPMDCNWTSYSFFKDPPDPPTADGSFYTRQWDVEYYPVTSDPRFGDILRLSTPEGKVIHSCVFLADNIVFTKNGASPLAPWILMTIPDLLDEYSPQVAENESLRLSYIRNKNYE